MTTAYIPPAEQHRLLDELMGGVDLADKIEDTPLRLVLELAEAVIRQVA